MPHANRYFLPGYVCHIAHPLREFHLFKLFKPKASIKDFPFARDRRRYLHWLFEARKRFGLCVLDYIVTSNHVHLLIKDSGSSVIAGSIQLIAGRTAQEYVLRRA